MLLLGLIVAIVALLALIISVYNIFINPIIKKEAVSAILVDKNCFVDAWDEDHRVTLDCEGHQQELRVRPNECISLKEGVPVNIIRVTRKNGCVKFKLPRFPF